eukprot:1562011-Prorocentrum_lima.AAC.1
MPLVLARERTRLRRQAGVGPPKKEKRREQIPPAATQHTPNGPHQCPPPSTRSPHLPGPLHQIGFTRSRRQEHTVRGEDRRCDGV